MVECVIEHGEVCKRLARRLAVSASDLEGAVVKHLMRKCILVEKQMTVDD